MKNNRKYYKFGGNINTMNKEIQKLIDERQRLLNELCIEMVKIDKGMIKIKKNEQRRSKSI